MIWWTWLVLFTDGGFVVTERGYEFVVTERIAAVEKSPDEGQAVENGVKQASEKAVVAPPGRKLVRQVCRDRERYLVSEHWCQNCPAARQKFLESGGALANILTLAEAKARFGVEPAGIPYQFERVVSREVVQAPVYRSVWPPNIDVLGNWNPTREELLKHLRTHPNHRGKHWQRWYLEAWERDQLVALHDDDHAGKVPVFADPE